MLGVVGSYTGGGTSTYAHKCAQEGGCTMRSMRELQIKDTQLGRFYYLDWGNEDHGRISFRLWVYHKFVETKENDGLQTPCLALPKTRISLVQGKRPRTLILRPGDRNLFEIFVPCGFRGGAQFEILTPVAAVYEYLVYRSERGSLGVSRGALVVTDQDAVTYRWQRTGRLYGDSPEGTTTIFIDGSVEEVEETDLCEIEDLAEV